MIQPQSRPNFGNNLIQVSEKNDNFLQWFLENKQAINDIINHWRGYEQDSVGRWIETDNSEHFRMMNEKGIRWSSGILKNYMDKVYQATNFDNENMNWQMRITARIVWRGLAVQWRLFQISKINVYVIGSQMMNTIHAMLLASRGEGIRKFIGTTQTISEQRVINPDEKKSFFSGISGAFQRN